MCSLSGIITKLQPEHPKANLDSVLRMLHRTRHRGPDGAGVHVSGRVYHARDVETLRDEVPDRDADSRVVVGQSRLAITGSRRLVGQQPFTSSDGVVALTHNGEIYNHRRVAVGLGADYENGSGSDSELLMRVLEHHREACGDDLAEAVRRTVGVASGMYALAVSDGRTVVLARDAIGKKPLYYVHGESRFAWASERKALVDVARTESAPIRPLKPGRMLICDSLLHVTEETVERLSQPAVDLDDMDEAIAAYGQALEKAVALRCEGLERAAVLFSGGIDSVLVARMLQRAGVEVTGYVSGTAESNDVANAVRIAERMDLPVRVSAVSEEDLDRWLPTIMRHTELNGPLMMEVSVPMWFASRAAHEDGHRVIFTGQAADELFAGYSWYGGVVADSGLLTLHARLWEDLVALPVDTLEREDRITMAWSLELRAPFLDSEVIRTAFRMSPHLKIEGPDDPQRKHPHRRLAVEMGIPHDVAYRRKEPAQDGADVHALLRRAGARWFPDGVPSGEVHDVVDFGSNYRYRDTPGEYQTPEVYAMLDAIALRDRILVAAADGTAVPPPAIPGPRLQAPHGVHAQILET